MDYLTSMPWYQDIDEWMKRVVNRSIRPLPPLVISGPTGTGKTAGITESARRNGIHIVSEGSDDTMPDDATRGSFIGEKAIATWKQTLSGRSLVTQILVIDDADTFLGRNGEKTDQFLDMARGATPVVVIAIDLYATDLLRGFTAKNSVFVKTKPLSAMQMQALLSREFPNTPMPTVKSVMALRPGDVRAARLALALGVPKPVDAGTHITMASSIFDVVNASLGIDGRMPDNEQTAEGIMRSNVESYAAMLPAHYVTACKDLPNDLEMLAHMAACVSAADEYSQMAEHMLLRRIPAAIREKRLQNSHVRPPRLDFRGPKGGPGSKEAADANRLFLPVAQSLTLLDLQVLQPDACPRFSRTQHADTRQPVNDCWQRRDDLSFLALKHGKVGDKLLTAKAAKDAIDGELAEYSEHPWLARKKPKVVEGKPM